MEFSSSQSAAIKHVSGPMLVLAGPGSGKTCVIAHRVKYLVEEEHISPSNILVITFTKAAAKEMENRYIQIASKRKERVTFGTFHAIFFRILKLAYNYSAENIVKDDFRYDVIRQCIWANHFEANDENEYITNALSEISLVKSERISLDKYYSVNFAENEFKVLYNTYCKALQSHRLIDFDDMMLYCYDLLEARKDILAKWQEKFQYICIDEFQDINRLQYEIIRMLAAPQDNIFIVGDDDQSIYGFRGAKPQIMLGFTTDYPGAKQVVLDINYRSTPAILEGAGNLISYNKNRFEKKIKACNLVGKPIEIMNFKDLAEENAGILKILSEGKATGRSLSDYAIITRTNVQPSLLISRLMEYNVPFINKDAMPNIYEHWIAKDIFAYIRIALGSNDRKDYLRIINRPKRYVHRAVFTKEQVDLEELFRYYADKDYMINRLEDFSDALGMIRALSPFSAVNFIYNGIGYGDYLAEYAEYRNINVDELKDVYEEILAMSKGYKSYDEWFEAIEEYGEKLTKQRKEAENTEGVIITTMHGAKGLEFDTVIIPDVCEGITPHKKAVFDAAIEEERRMFYVAMTRAKRRLVIMTVGDRYNKELLPSRFIEEIKEDNKKTGDNS
ncbi:MAG: ATP-dependent helicase [Lachnospiraceae bacterium]|nr:ATP-dependent helicase [Lachnospiraceae bacterium]